MKTVNYSFPLNKRGRLLLKLKNLFDEITYWKALKSEQSIKGYLQCIFSIMLLLERIDIRVEMHKELEKFPTQPDIDLTILNKSGRFGESIRSKPLFAQLHKRINQPGGLCCFDMPALYTWLQLDASEQERQISRPFEDIQLLHNLIDSLFDYFSTFENINEIRSNEGFATINPQPKSSILRINIPFSSKNLTPEVSASPKAVVIKFWTQTDLLEKPQASSQCFDFHYSEV